MKHYATNVFRDAPSDVERQARLAHFLECSRLCQATRFKSEVEERIMDLYCEGKSHLEIKSELADVGVILHRETISKKIRKYLILFGLYSHGK